MELSIKDIFEILMRRLWIIIMCFVIAAIVAFGYTTAFVPKTYVSKLSLYVDNKTSTSLGVTPSDLTSSTQLASTYIEILKSDTFLKKVSDKSGLGYTPSSIRLMLNMQVVGETQIFSVAITSISPADSLTLASSIEQLAPEELKRVVATATVTVVDSPSYPSGPSGPNVPLNTMIGALIGLAISIIIVFLIERFDIRIKNEEDLLKNYSLPVLGGVPAFKKSIPKI
jgi:capsular polysaccharide biosynthesis protein